MIADEMEENATRQRNFTAIVTELGKRHKIEFDVWVPKRLNISMKFDAIVGGRIAIMRRGKFEFQVQKLQDVGYSIYVVPKGPMSVAAIKEFVDMVEQKDGIDSGT